MLSNIYVYELEVDCGNTIVFRYTYGTLERAIETAWRKYDYIFEDNALLGRREFKKRMNDKMWYDEGEWSISISRSKMEVDIPKTVNSTTVGNIICGGFSAALEYVIYHGVHEDGDVLWESEVNGPLTPDDAISNYVVTYMTIDWEFKRLIIETL